MLVWEKLTRIAHLLGLGADQGVYDQFVIVDFDGPKLGKLLSLPSLALLEKTRNRNLPLHFYRLAARGGFEHA